MVGGEPPGQMDSCLHVTLLGSLAAVPTTPPGLPPVTHFRTQKTATLFAYLAFHAGVPQSREELCERFWPDSALEQARMSLRTSLSSLRKDFGETIVADKTNVTLQATTDLQQFELATRRASLPALSEQERVESLRRAVEVYGGPLLPGLYDDWIFKERDRLAGGYLAALSALSRWHRGLNQLGSALEYARRAAAAQPLSEELRGELISLLKTAGYTLEARRQYEDLERVLDEQLGAAPSGAMRTLVEGLSEGALSDNRGSKTVVQLPPTWGRFRGRSVEVSALVQRLSGGKSDSEGAHLFTLFGPGGIGKTRLAIEVARRLAAHHFFSLVCFVSLAAAKDEEQLWKGLQAALALPVLPHLSVQSQVVAHLRAFSSALLVCDNLEQTLPGGEGVLETLLSAVPGLVLLATSRQRLAISGEVLIAVGALPEDEAVPLFVDRARAIEPNFSLNPGNEQAIRALCRALEGIPLALELAAAWAGTLTPEEMCLQIEDSALRLPERRGGEGRHHSLTAAITWSLALLEPPLRDVFCRLSVFRGGFDAEAALAVCGASRHALASLRDRSLLQTVANDVGMRFQLHENVRIVGESLLVPPQPHTLATQHAQYFADLAQQSRQGITGSDEHQWLRRLDADWANLHGAIDARLGMLDDPSGALGLCCHLTDYLSGRCQWRLGLDWLLRGLQAGERIALSMRLESLTNASHFADMLDSGAPEAAQELLSKAEALAEICDDPSARALLGLRQAYYWGGKRGEITRAISLVSGAVATYREVGNFVGVVLGLIQLGAAHLRQGNLVQAQPAFEEALLLADQRGWSSTQAQARSQLGQLHCDRNELALAEGCFQEALVDFERLGLINSVADQQMNLARVAYLRGESRAARALLERAQAHYTQLGDETHSMFALHNLGVLAYQEGDYLGQRGYQSTALRWAVGAKNLLAIIAGLENLAVNWDVRGQSVRGAQLCGAAAELRRVHQLPHAPALQQKQDEIHAGLEQALGPQRFAEAFAQGATLTLDEAVGLALAD